MVKLRQVWSHFHSTKEDPLAPFGLPLRILRLLGLRIRSDSSWIYIIYGITAPLFLVATNLLLQLMYLPRAASIVEITEVMSIMVSALNCFCEIFVLYYNISRITEVMEEIEGCIAEFGVDDKFISRCTTVNKIMKGALCFALYSLTGSMISCIAFHQLGFRMWLPVDVEDTFNFWLTFVYQWIGTYYVTPLNVTFQLLPAHFMVYIYGLLEQLCERLEALKLNERKGNRKELVKCIELHTKIFEISRKVSAIFSINFLIRGTVTCVLLCSTTFSIFAISDTAIITQFASYILFILIQLFISCYYGTMIASVSGNISSAIGHTEWMFENREYRQLVCIVLQFSVRPLKISSFGLFDVNLETYAQVVKSAYTLFALCKHFYDN